MQCGLALFCPLAGEGLGCEVALEGSDDRFRDGKRAVELATNACELSSWKNAYGVCTLAAAYAEAGDFENAVKWQEEFLRLCSEVDRKKWSYLLDLYKSGKPYRREK